MTSSITILLKAEDVLSYYDKYWDKWKTSASCFLTPLEILIIENHKKLHNHKFVSRFLGLPDSQVYVMYKNAIKRLKWYYSSYIRWVNNNTEKPTATNENFLDMPLNAHFLSARLYGCLCGIGKTLREILKEFESRQLLKRRGFGKTSLLELRNLLDQNNCLHLLK